MIDLGGRRALVTGGSRGIGAAVALLLARAGAHVGIAYRSRRDDAETVLAKLRGIGAKSFAYAGDLATKEANEAFVLQGVQNFGGLDIFVANSGIWPPVPVDTTQLTDERWRQTLSTNVDGMFFGARAAAAAMSDGGRMIFVSSTAGQRGEAGHSDYAASKGAMISFVKSLAVEVANGTSRSTV